MTGRSRRRSMASVSATLVVVLTVAACQANASPTASVTTAPTSPDAASPAAAGSPASLDVPTWKGGNTRTGVHPGPGPAAAPAPLWDVRVDHDVYSQPLVVDGTVIVATTGGDLLGIDADTGEPAWDTVHLGAGIRSQPAADSGTLYVVTDDGMLHAFSLADRRERWPALAGFDEQAVIAVADGLVIAGRPGELVGIRAADGAEAWRAKVDGFTRLRVAVDGGFAYVTADGSGDMSRVDLADRERVEQWRLGGANGLTASPDRDGVVVGYLDDAGGVNGVVAFAPDGTEAWRQSSLDNARVEMVTVAGNLVLVATEVPARIEARNRAGGGELMWVREYGGPYIGGNVVAGDVVYLIGVEDGLVAIDLATADTLWSVPFGASQQPVRMVVTDGLIIASAPTDDGAARVIAYADPADPRSIALRSAPPAPSIEPAPSVAATPIYEVLDTGTTVEGDLFMASPSLGPDGTLYLAEPNTSRVLVRAPDGTISWWGSPGSGEGEFNFHGGGERLRLPGRRVDRGRRSRQPPGAAVRRPTPPHPLVWSPWRRARAVQEPAGDGRRPAPDLGRRRDPQRCPAGRRGRHLHRHVRGKRRRACARRTGRGDLP